MARSPRLLCSAHGSTPLGANIQVCVLSKEVDRSDRYLVKRSSSKGSLAFLQPLVSYLNVKPKRDGPDQRDGGFRVFCKQGLTPKT